MCIFNKSKTTCLETEPFCCCKGWNITLVGSQFTHATESCYTPVEGEALAIANAPDKARFFVLGCSNLNMAVEHKPLLKVFDEITNARLRNLKEKKLCYRFQIVHIPDVRHKATDAVSRHPTGTTKPDLLVLPDDVAAATAAMAILPQLDTSRHSILASIHHSEPPPGTCSITIYDKLASSASSALSTEAVTWERVKLATARHGDMT